MRGITMLFWGFAVLCAASAVPLQRIHEQMTPSERMQAFKTMGDDVVDYEITSIHWPRVEKRSADGSTGIYLRAFGSDIELWLQPTEGILVGYDTPVYLLKSGDSGPDLTEYSDVMEKLQAYEDLKKSAALVVRQRDDNSRAMIGTIASENLVITPIPERLVEEVKRQRRSVDDIPESEQDDHHYHIVYKKAPPAVDQKYSELLMASVDYPKLSATKTPERPDIVYPELLIVVTHDLYKKLGKDFWYATAYIVAFWNSVDLKYRYFENPKFRLNIAGIVLTEDDEVLDYMTANEYSENVTKGSEAVRASGPYWYARKEDIPLDAYDVIVTMTSRELCSFYAGEKKCDSGTLGVALVGGACHRNDYYQEQFNVAIITDSAAFDGIHTATHELGHSFGALHDGINHKDCPSQDGHIMAGSRRVTENSAEWSKCSVNDIQEFLDTNPTCLYNKPNHRAPLPRYLPGRFMNADKQCEKLEGTKACEINAGICTRLSCINPERNEYCTKLDIAAADGTECGGGKMCLNGRCIRPPKF
ncbi:venom metalloproteinase 3 isoform X2 [Diachasma alloeum]|uniref:venom metalloproteinase 3 isoform X2 n=1 Tax=Diachasma alloeum TaxID=454923 RepID=UPI000738108F|nr:venom metalloproteinase 3 isoform X2 [Diachasma alloeum]